MLIFFCTWQMIWLGKTNGDPFLENLRKSLIVCQNENYWAMSMHDNISHHLPQLFIKIHYHSMLGFMGKKPMFSPLHIWDLMQDSNNIRHPTKTPKFTIDEPIYFSGSGVWTKWVFCELKIVGDLRKKCPALIKLQAYKP